MTNDCFLTIRSHNCHKCHSLMQEKNCEFLSCLGMKLQICITLVIWSKWNWFDLLHIEKCLNWLNFYQRFSKLNLEAYDYLRFESYKTIGNWLCYKTNLKRKTNFEAILVTSNGLDCFPRLFGFHGLINLDPYLDRFPNNYKIGFRVHSVNKNIL